ncbi:MAG TPA: hypothetical protein VM093_07970 [Aeromicrobium sp.]|nr:hypothetical protein [Aeromicrobium sp.]
MTDAGDLPRIRAAAVCPQAPALVPEVGQGVADDLAGVRTACQDAVSAVIAAGPERIVVLGAGDLDEAHDESAGGSFRGFGPDIRAGGRDLVLPPSLTLGAWLLDIAGWTGRRTYTTTSVDADGDAWLVMADGSSRHRRLAPEWSDDEGRAFDATVAKALAGGSPDALAALDLTAAADVGASGFEGLVALGGITKGARVAAQLRFDGAPFDVGYWVADWQVSW